MKKYYILISLFLSFGVSAKHKSKFENVAFELKEIHQVMFDLYFPEDAQLSTTEKKKRLEWRENLWIYLRSKPDIIALLDLLQPSSPFLHDDIKQTFSDIIDHGITGVDKERMQQFQYILRRHPDNNVRKYAATLRKLYSYLVYSSPLTSKIAGYRSQVADDTHDSPCSLLPATK